MDRIKIKFTRPEFTYKDKVTICKLSFYVKELDLEYTVKAVSKCNESDKYNKVIGERVSQARAEIKARNIVKEYATNIMRYLKDRLSGYEKLLEEINNFNDHDRTEINKYLSK